MKETIKRMFSRDNIFGRKENIPRFLYKRYYKLLLFTGISLILGTACVIMAKNLILILPFSFLVISLLVISLYFKQSIEEKGFTVIKGKVIYVKEAVSTDLNMFGGKAFRKPSYYHIQTDDGELIRIAANKVSEEMPKGAAVTVYAPLDVFTYDRNGVMLLSTVWGYELAGGEGAASSDEG